MSNARWRASTSAADVPAQSAAQAPPETPGAAQLQAMLERLKQRPSLQLTVTAASAAAAQDSSAAACDARDWRGAGGGGGGSQRGSARCRSSTGVSRQPPPPSTAGRQGSAAAHSAERHRSRYSDVTEPAPADCAAELRRDRRAGHEAGAANTDRSARKTDGPTGAAAAPGAKEDSAVGGGHGAGSSTFRGDTSEQTEPREDATPPRGGGGAGRGAAGGRRSRQPVPAPGGSQSALSWSADSGPGAGTPPALTPDTSTQTSLVTGSPGRQTPRVTATGPPAGSAARQFQARARREPAQETPRPAGTPASTNSTTNGERTSDGGSAVRGRPTSIPPIVRKTLMDFDRIQKLKYAAETAMREKKVFMIHGGYPSIRLALKRRGWVEKKYLINRNESEDDIDVSRWPVDTDNTVTSIGLADVLSLKGSKNSMILTRLLKDHQPNLIWSAKREVVDYVNLERDQLVNHFPRAPFNTKVGLCSLAQGLHWFSEAMAADSFLPRAFRIGIAEEKQQFVEDFRLTACAGLLVWFKERYELHGAAGVEDADGEVPYSVIPTALQQCQAYIATCQHEDIEPSAFNRALWPHQWDNFLTNVYKVVHRNKKLEKHRDENSTIVKVFYNRITQLLTELIKYRPQTLLDGWLNIWIVKPGSSSRGRGIVLLRQLEDVLALVESPTQREGKYVVQKYIERPMLIYNTKFDIRQWFLVTDWNPLTVWMYKQSYLRFCSQQFTLGDLKEAVHLCNNAIQARYRNGERHAALPTENMWDSSTFQQFLKSREAGHAWDQIIYPAMKSAIISLCVASQAELEPRKGCFELFGADFLLTEDYHPWLIEVNSSPAMGASTSVTAWLCAMCLEDVIRVIVDRRKDSHADVGEFECILQQPPVSSPRYLGIDLSVHGHKLKPPPGAAPPAAPQPPQQSPPAAAQEPPVSPRSPATGSSVMTRATEALSRLTSLPGTTATAANAATQVRRRSRSQAPPAAPPPSGPTAAAAAAARRNRSVPRPAVVEGRAVPVQQQTPPPVPTPSQTAAQKARQKPNAKKATGAAARRRSRTQLIQHSVRRLSDPRRPRSGQRSGAGTPPQAPAPAACPVPRGGLDLSGRRRQPPSPRAAQLVTCGRLQEPLSARPGSAAAAQRRRGAAATSATSLPVAGARTGAPAASSATSLPPPAPSQPTTGPGDEQEQTADATVTITAGDAAAADTGDTDGGSVASEAPCSVAVTGQRLISSSLDELARIRRSSEATVRRINSLSLAVTPAVLRSERSTVEEVHMQQMGKVKWVAMPSAPPHPPPNFLVRPVASSSGGSGGGGGGSGGPAAAPVARPRSPVARPRSPALTAAAGSAGWSPQRPVSAGRSVSPVPRALSPHQRPATPVIQPRAGPGPTGAGAGAVSPRPASRGGVTAPAPRPSSGGDLVPVVGVGRLLPPPGPPPPPPLNTRITELKTLIDRAIEETRQFLGRSRPPERPSPPPPPAESVTSPTPVTPRPCLSPTIVDIAVRRPAAGSSAWERAVSAAAAAASGVSDQGGGSARLSPRRGSPAAAALLARPEPPRLTELVGLQGRRFLPQLVTPEPAPRRAGRAPPPATTASDTRH